MGLAGKPQDPDAFVRFEADGTEIYLAREIWAGEPPGTQRVRVLLPGFGSFEFRFDAEPPQ